MQFDKKLSIIILCLKIGRVYYMKGVGDLKLFTTKRAEWHASVTSGHSASAVITPKTQYVAY